MRDHITDDGIAGTCNIKWEQTLGCGFSRTCNLTEMKLLVLPSQDINAYYSK